MANFIDTHSHIYLNKNKSEKEIIENFKKLWWKYMVCIWIDLESSKKAVELSKKYDFIFATIWIHPSDSIKYIWDLENTIKALENLYIENKKYIVGIWETWLDYYHTDKNNTNEINNQKDFFKAQIELSKIINLPLIIHNRETKNDIFEIIKETNLKNFIIHCFSENLDYANKLISYSSNCMISFSWIVTYNSGKNIQETAKNIPLKNILIETDSPFLTPWKKRWKEENEPWFTKYMLEKIIELRDELPEEIENTILQNSMKIFWIKK